MSEVADKPVVGFADDGMGSNPGAEKEKAPPDSKVAIFALVTIL